MNEKLLASKSLAEIASEFQSQVQLLADASDKPRTTEKILVEPLDWFSPVGHRFVRLGVSHNVAGTPMYKEGALYGIDVSSAAAVVALEISAGEHVLDLCCAPGAKLSMISDALHQEEDKLDQDALDLGPWKGTVTGVDISQPRLSSCRTLSVKYQLDNVRLFLDDACLFNTLAPPARRRREKTIPTISNNVYLAAPVFPADADEVLPEALTAVPEKNSRTKRAQRKKQVLERLTFAADWSLTSVASQLYDKALVDAQCTLDASIRHLLNYNKVGWIGFDANPTKVISQLQKRMIFNAFRLLKPGGALVYSTCSFCTAQNENVVRWLLHHEPTAQVVPIKWPSTFTVPLAAGSLEHTIRFYPKDSGTSGMFIAKVRKNAPPQS